MRKLFFVIRIKYSIRDEIVEWRTGSQVLAVLRHNEISQWKLSMRRGFMTDGWTMRDGKEGEFYPTFTHLRCWSRRLPWRCSFRSYHPDPSDRAQIGRKSGWAHRRSRPASCRTRVPPKSRRRIASRSAGKTWNRPPSWNLLCDSSSDGILSNRLHL